jgi:predicted membrane metal-binding protein
MGDSWSRRRVFWPTILLTVWILAFVLLPLYLFFAVLLVGVLIAVLGRERGRRLVRRFGKL